MDFNPYVSRLGLTFRVRFISAIEKHSKLHRYMDFCPKILDGSPISYFAEILWQRCIYTYIYIYNIYIYIYIHIYINIYIYNIYIYTYIYIYIIYLSHNDYDYVPCSHTIWSMIRYYMYYIYNTIWYGYGT